jgi:hypothetical protein
MSLFYGSHGMSCAQTSRNYQSLGSLEEIISRSARCDFCNLVFTTSQRHYSIAGKKYIFESETMPVTWPDGSPISVDISSSHVSTSTERGGHVYLNSLLVTLKPPIWNRKILDSSIKFQPFWTLENQSTLLEQRSRESGNDVGPPQKKQGQGRLVGSQIEFGLLRSWLHTCENQHGRRCSSPDWFSTDDQTGVMSWLRLIDINERRIVNAPPSPRYVALNYVWGMTGMPLKEKLRRCATKASLGNMRRRNGLDREVLLPQTIRDAIRLCLRFQLQYLWVDSLCIVQDDPTDVAYQTSLMDAVYSNALFTIIAAAGSDCSASLPGVTPQSRNINQQRAFIHSADGWELSAMLSLEQGISQKIESSTWRSRGWTFQERQLSRRTLTFLPNQVHWTCTSAKWKEETIREPPLNSQRKSAAIEIHRHDPTGY